MSGKGDRKGNRGKIVVIRKEEVVEAGHHGGAWKVAYADFVTAMMAFFLLMWLLNATSEEQRKGLADYFSPQNLFSRSTSGSGRPFGGRTPYEEGALVSDRGAVQVVTGTAQPMPAIDDQDSDTLAQPGAAAASDSTADAAAQSAQTGTTGTGTTGTGTRTGTAGTAMQRTADAAAKRADQAKREQAAFDQAAQQIQDAVRTDPGLADLAKQLTIDQTPEGLRIQILDQEKQPMFAFGSSAPNDRARLLLQKVGPVLLKLSENISITGHTDAAPYRGTDKSNWELSTERANATRRLLIEAGLPDQRFRSVSGDADRDPLLPADPMAAANRRIAIVVLRQAPPSPPPRAQLTSVQPSHPAHDPAATAPVAPAHPTP